MSRTSYPKAPIRSHARDELERLVDQDAARLTDHRIDVHDTALTVLAIASLVAAGAVLAVIFVALGGAS